MKKHGLVVLFLAALASPAGAYVRMQTPDGVPLEWRRGCPAFTISARPGPGLSALEIAAMIEEARVAWEDGGGGCAQLPIEVVAHDAAGTIEYDGANQLFWREPGHCDQPGTENDEVCLSPNAAAVTTLFFYDRGERVGEIIEVDMELSGELTFGLAGELDRVDLRSVTTHELGHALGLEHTCETIPGRAPLLDSSGLRVPYCSPMYALPETIRWATMFPYLREGEVHARTPFDDERGGVCDLYRDHSGRCEETGPGCGCRGAGGPSAALALLVMLLLWRQHRRAAGSTRHPARGRRSGT